MNAENTESPAKETKPIPDSPPVVDKKITPDVQKAMDRLRGYTPKSKFYWVPELIKSYLPRKEWPIFEYANRDAADVAESDDRHRVLTDKDGMQFNTNKNRLYILSQQIKNWKNYKDKAGNDVPCLKEKDGSIREESLNRLSKELQIELMDAINNEDHLTEEERAGLEF
jgi:hypothetical protein